MNGRRTQDRATHLSMIDPKGKFSITGNDVDAFMDLYCMESQTDGVFGILEMTNMHTVIPVLVDADIKKEVPAGAACTPLYTPEFVLRLVRVYQKVLPTIVDEDLTDDDLLCVVFQKEPYLDEKPSKTYLKHGFHLHFPKLFIDRTKQETELIPRVKLEWKKSVSQTEFNLNIDKVIDGSYCRGPWLLYRGRKAEGKEPYLISFVVDGDGVVHDDWRRHLLYMHVEKADKKPIELTWDNIDFHLPRILSISPSGKECYIRNIREDLIPIPSNMMQKQHDIHQQLNNNRVNMLGQNHHRNEDESEMVDKLLDILGDFRAEERNEWMNVGWSLFNIFNGSEEGLEKWIRFSQRSPDNFSYDVCRYEWSKMTKRDMTIASLKFMARTDNVEKYNDVIKAFMKPYLESSMKLKGSHNDLAKALKEKHEGNYACASIKEKIWYEYNNHGWNRIDEGFSLRMKISDELVHAYEEILRDLCSRYSKAEEDEQAMFKKKVDNCLKIIGSLKCANFKTNVMRECMEVFYKPSFFSDLDTNPFLFTFMNGVYDLKTHHFRDGRPSDMNSIRAPIKYRDDLHRNHPEVMRVIEFFEQIFPDKTVRDYFMNVSCQVFIGGNHSKIFQVWTGDGDNGKSVTQSLFEKMLGPYSIKLPTSLIIGKRTQSSAACPELVRAGNGVRFAMLQEPDQKDTINVGILKELSGNDSFFARGLYKEGSEITPMFKLVLICNEPPKLPHNDKATWNRVRVIPFESVFSDNAPDDPDEQMRQKVFPKDPQFGNKVSSMAEAFAWLLLDHLKQNPKVGIEPEKVKLATENYRRKNDVYRQFVEDVVEMEQGAVGVTVQQLYNQFKEWFRDGCNSALPPRDDFREYMTKIIGEPEYGIWKGVRIRSQQLPEEFMNQEEA